jgi:hypothetical protein
VSADVLRYLDLPLRLTTCGHDLYIVTASGKEVAQVVFEHPDVDREQVAGILMAGAELHRLAGAVDELVRVARGMHDAERREFGCLLPCSQGRPCHVCAALAPFPAGGAGLSGVDGEPLSVSPRQAVTEPAESPAAPASEPLPARTSAAGSPPAGGVPSPFETVCKPCGMVEATDSRKCWTDACQRCGAPAQLYIVPARVAGNPDADKGESIEDTERRHFLRRQQVSFGARPALTIPADTDALAREAERA